MDDSKTDVKNLLRALRSQSGLSQKELALAVGTSTRTIHNAESLTEGMPEGLTMLRMLQALGAVVDAPKPPQTQIEIHLRSLEDLIGVQGEATTRALDGVAEEVRALARRLDQGDGQATEAAG